MSHPDAAWEKYLPRQQLKIRVESGQFGRKRTRDRMCQSHQDPCNTEGWIVAGPKDFKRTLGEGSSGGGVQGCQKKLGQKSDISRVLGSLLGRRGMGMGLAGRLQSVALIGNRGGSPIFSSGPDGTTWGFLILFVKEMSLRYRSSRNCSCH